MGQPACVGHRPDPAPGDPCRAGRRDRRAVAGRPPPGLLRRRDRLRRHPRLLASRHHPGPAGERAGGHRGVRLHGAAAPRVHRPRRRLPQHHRDPRG